MDPVTAGYVAIAAGSVLSGLFGSRSASKDRKANRESDKYNFAAQRYFKDIDRQRQLEDRLYTEKAIGGYRQFNKRPALMGTGPAYTDPSTVKPVLPQYGKKFP